MTNAERAVVEAFDDRKVFASFETPRARIIGHSYKAKDHALKIVIELPADPTFASAMLRMRDELVRIKLVYEGDPPEPDDTPSMFD